MKSLADMLMGQAPAPTQHGRRHVCEDDSDELPPDPRPMAEQVREWCSETNCAITLHTVATQFGIAPHVASTYLNRLGKRGFLVRVRIIKPGGRSRPVQIWAVTSAPEAVRRFKRAA